eukprot:gb/GFBE01028079.1/.p1 GENE.gb/GFBE01028079.1/~~gb/GFBE01028079.1/.p1  ORF type:complete len:291 (+),score=55.96 gb/GFBE01028079.1/:1-873(+)
MMRFLVVLTACQCLLCSASAATCASETCAESDQGSLLQVETGRRDQAVRQEQSKWGFECFGVSAAINVFRGTLDSQIRAGIQERIPSTYTSSASDGVAESNLTDPIFETLGCSGHVEAITGSVRSITFDPSNVAIKCLKGQLFTTLTLQVDVHIPKLTLGTSAFGTLNAVCPKFPWAPVNELTDLFNLTYAIEDIRVAAVIQGSLSGTNFKLSKAESATATFGKVHDFKCQLVQERHGEETAEACSSALEVDVRSEKAIIESMFNKVIAEQVLPELPDKVQELLAAQGPA